MGNFFGRMIGRDTEPVYAYPDGPPMPWEGQITPDGPVYRVDLGQGMPAMAPVQIGEEKVRRPSPIARFVRGAAPILRGAMVGAATPNIAGGGGTDMARAFVAADDDRRQQQEHQMMLERQRRIDAMNEERVRAAIAEDNARAQALLDRGNKPAPPPKYYAVGSHGYVDAQGQFHQSPDSERPRAPLVVGGAVYDPNSKEWKTPPPKREMIVGGSVLERQPDGSLKATFGSQRSTPWTYKTDAQGQVTAVRVGEGNKPETVTFSGQIDKPQRQPAKKSGDGPKRGTQTQFNTLERWKEGRMTAIRKETRRRLDKEAKLLNGDMDRNKEAAIWADDQRQMADTQKSYEQQIVTLGGSISQPQQPPASPASGPPARRRPLAAIMGDPVAR